MKPPVATPVAILVNTYKLSEYLAQVRWQGVGLVADRATFTIGLPVDEHR